MSVSRWDPFQDLLAIQDEMNQVFGRARTTQGGRVWAPALDISERKDAYVVTVEVPGVKADDLDITLEDGLLTIQGERQFTSESSEQQYHRVERRYGSFRRSITLPSQVKADAIEASFEDGVLEVVVPKAEEAKPKKISVRAGGGRQQVEGTSTPADGNA
ncbi:MAG TPA: Hsp20/alpha crystallin family protein [Actinomycetota bacterium]|nr:Hsp20/alpha crystallin family protein [Actinomycetota bacterium]